MKLLLTLPAILLLSACVTPRHYDCETDYTIDYRFCNQKETDGPNQVLSVVSKPPVDTPSRPVDKPPVDNGGDSGGDTSSGDHNGPDTGDDNSSDDSNGGGTSDDDNDDKPGKGPKNPKDDNGHGNDPGKFDPSNPGKGKGKPGRS